MIGNMDSGNGTAANGPEVPYRRYLWLLTCAWTCAVGGSLAWNLAEHAEDTQSLTSYAARALLEKDLLYREWSILHGGVYVPKSEPADPAAPPQDREREITTPSGQVLTLLNPAVVSRQIFELQNQETGIRGHITSLSPVRAANAPDAWERQALRDFHDGRQEVSSTETIEGQRYFRVMRPLVTKTTCLRCHEEQGRQVGTIRGGISVTVPLSQFATPGENGRLVVAHASLWLLGMAGLVLGAQNLQRHVRGRRRAEAEREVRTAQLSKEIAERQRAQEALQLAADELERSNRDLEQFAYVASHDLQEPLRAVSGFIRLLRARFPDQVDAKATEYIRGACDGAERMERLIKGLLAYSRVGTNAGDFVPGDLNVFLGDAFRNLQASLKAAEAQVTHDSLPSLPVDGTQITQLFQNLIGNAVKFRGEQPPQIPVGARREPERWVFSVRDKGIGIEPQYFERIFQLFQRLHTRDHYPGTGIGLAICKRIVERHGGTIWVESQPGQGSTFFFSMPASSG